MSKRQRVIPTVDGPIPVASEFRESEGETNTGPARIPDRPYVDEWDASDVRIQDLTPPGLNGDPAPQASAPPVAPSGHTVTLPSLQQVKDDLAELLISRKMRVVAAAKAAREKAGAEHKAEVKRLRGLIKIIEALKGQSLLTDMAADLASGTHDDGQERF